MTGRGGKPIHWVEAFGLSALVHVGLVFFALDFVNDLNLFEPPEEDKSVDIIVTSLQFDNISVDQPSDTTGVDGDAGEGLEAPTDEPESLQDVAPEPVPAEEPAAPEVAEEPELPVAETPEAVEPEALTPEPVAPEPLTAEPVEPEPLVAEEVQPEIAEAAPEALQPVTPEAPALAPEPLSPLRPDDDTVAALAPVDGGSPERLSAAATTLAPVAIAPSSAPAAVAPAIGTTTTRIAPVSSRPAVPAPAPSRPAVEPPAPGSPQAVVNELVAKIRANTTDACLVAMPQQGEDGAPELVMLAADEAGITAFAADVLSEIEPRPAQRGVLIDPRQCAAATFIRENTSYPAFRLSLGVVEDRLPSGEELTGVVGRAAGAYVTLLLVDDNGVVQDLGGYLSFAGADARFAVPMRREIAARDTSQMLIALTTDARPRTLDTQNGQLAEDFFPALKAEIGTAVPLVMIPFDVR